ncbi:MAG: hypothetical protein ACI9VI_000983 [Candidatus Azotimanducaceae bacterium]|jgi:hypothetical protein
MVILTAFTDAIVAQLAILYSGIYQYVMFGLMFVFGGVTLPLYSILLAHPNDNSRLPLIQVGSIVLLSHSLGAMICPLYFPL